MRYYICYFFIYAFLGWIMEVLYALYDDKQLVNRGFLIGPYCPIYGWGSVFIIYFLQQDLSDPIAVYLKAILIAAILEYLTSFVMEKLFHARWWDYSDNKFNINGRICLETLLPFGVLAIFIVYIINPLIYKYLILISLPILDTFLIVLCILLVVDTIISFKTIFGIRGIIMQTTADSTISIKNYLREKKNIRKKEIIESLDKLICDRFSRNSALRERIVKAFPNIHVDFEKVRNRIEKKSYKRKKN